MTINFEPLKYTQVISRFTRGALRKHLDFVLIFGFSSKISGEKVTLTLIGSEATQNGFHFVAARALRSFGQKVSTFWVSIPLVIVHVDTM